MNPSTAAVSFASAAARSSLRRSCRRSTAIATAAADAAGRIHVVDAPLPAVRGVGGGVVRLFGSGGGSRGSRGHGWWVNYRSGKGGRHLQGTYSHLDDDERENAMAWNEAVLAGLGSTRCYLDVRLESRIVDETTERASSGGDDDGSKVKRLVLDLATGALPIATRNFGALLEEEAKGDGYRGTTFHRIEKGVGFLGGLVAEKPTSNPNAPETKRRFGRCHPSARMVSSPTAMDVSKERSVLRHRAGVLTMLQPRIGEIDSRFLLLTEDAPHLDGVSVAIGRLAAAASEEEGGDCSLETLRGWESSLITSMGVPTTAVLRIVDCGFLPAAATDDDDDAASSERQQQPRDDSEKKKASSSSSSSVG